MQKMSASSAVWGLVLIVLGLGFLLDSTGTYDFWGLVSNWWPVVFFIIAIGNLIDKKFTTTAIWAVIGIVVQLAVLNILITNVFSVLVAILLIIVGARILMRSGQQVEVEKGEVVSATAIFSGVEKRIDNKDFKGASATAIFGGTKIDLRNAKLSSGGSTIDVMTLFGGTEILVPKDMPVKLDVFALFGGSDEKRSGEVSPDTKPRLTVRGTCLFGGVEVKD